MQQCPTCGSLNPEGATVCADCGMELPTHAAAPAHPATPVGASAAPSPTHATEAPTHVTDIGAPAVPSPSAFDFADESAPKAGAEVSTPASAASAVAHDPFAGSQWDFDLDKAVAPTPAPEAAPASAAPTTVIDPSPAAPAPAAPLAPTGIGTAKLTLKRGGAPTGDVFSIGPSATVGRFDPESGPVDVDMAQLPEAVYISRHHAEINLRDGQWMVKDLGSRNGTFVKNASGFARVTGETALSNGDEVAFGNARFEFSTV